MNGAAANGTLGNRTMRSALAASALSCLLFLSPPVLADDGVDPSPTVRTATGAYLAGRIAQGRNDVSGAARYTAQALASVPDSPELQARSFLLDLSAGNIDRALQLVPSILEVEPDNLLAHIVMAARDTRLDDPAGALEHLQGGLGDSVAQYILPLLAGWSLADDGKFDAAIAAVEPMLAIQGMEGAALLHIGMIHDFAGDLTSARDAYESALSLRQTYRLTQVLGRLYERVGEPENALTLYEGFDRDGGEQPLLARETERVRSGEVPEGPLFSAPEQGMAEALADLAGLWRREAAHDSALIYAQLARYLRPDLGRATVIVADILALRGRSGEALAIYREVPADHPFSWSSRMNEARMMDELGDTDAAVVLLNAMARERPEAAAPLIRIGDIQRSERNFAEAVEAYDRAYARQADQAANDWSFLYKRGIALERAKQWDLAEKDLLAAVALRPDYAHLLNYLGYSYIDRGEMVQESERLIRQAVDLEPDDGFIIDSLGWVYYRTGRLDKAVEMLERAVELEPDDPTINDHLGDAYWMVGRRNEARFQWQRALDSDTDDTDLIDQLNRKMAEGLVEHGVLADYVDQLKIKLD